MGFQPNPNRSKTILLNRVQFNLSNLTSSDQSTDTGGSMSSQKKSPHEKLIQDEDPSKKILGALAFNQTDDPNVITTKLDLSIRSLYCFITRPRESHTTILQDHRKLSFKLNNGVADWWMKPKINLDKHDESMEISLDHDIHPRTKPRQAIIPSQFIKDDTA